MKEYISKIKYGVQNGNGDIYMPGCFDGSMNKDLRLVDHQDNIIGVANLSHTDDGILLGASGNLAKQLNDIVRLALMKHGIDPDDIQFLSDNITRVLKDDDPFEHYYLHAGATEQKRIISIEKETKIDYRNDESGNLKIIATRNWY